MPEDALVVGFLLAFVWCGMLTFHELRQNTLKLEDELAVSVSIETNPILQEYGSQSERKRLFYIAIKNQSARALRNVTVYLTSIDPPVQELNWLPIPLHIKHDTSNPYHDSFSMNPHGIRHIDLVSQGKDRDILIEHIVQGINRAIPIETYILTVRVEGHDIPLPEEEKYLVKVDHNGRLRCLPGAFSDLDKGLWEFSKDYKADMDLATRSLAEITKSIIEISRAVKFATNVMSIAARPRPITIFDVVRGIKEPIDRLIKASPLMAKPIDNATQRLEREVEIYRVRVNSMIKNFTGYAELATGISDEEIETVETALQTTVQSLRSTKSWRAAIVSTQQTRQSTHITRAMKRLTRAVDNYTERTESVLEAFEAVIHFARSKGSQNAPENKNSNT